MAQPQKQENVKVSEAVGVFDDVEALSEAVTELEHTAFSRETLSVLGDAKAIEEKFGKPVVNPDKAAEDPDAPRRPPVRTEEKSIGTGAIIGGGAYIGAVGALLTAGAAVTVPAVITAAALGGGGGGLLAKMLGDRYGSEIEDQIEKGGLVLWVQTRDKDREELACHILKKHGAHNVHVHEIK